RAVSSSCCRPATSAPEARPVRPWRTGSMNTTASAGTPPTRCSPRSPTNGPKPPRPRHEHTNHPLRGHEQHGGGFAAADTHPRSKNRQDHYIGRLYGFRGLPPQDHPDELEHLPVTDPLPQAFQYEIEPEPVEEALDVGVDHPGPAFAHRF